MEVTVGLPGGKTGVCLLPLRQQVPEHELQSHRVLAEKIAILLGLPMTGIYDADPQPSGSLYLIPSDTLIGEPTKNRLGLHTTADFFGGWVAEPFIGTKAITHPLFDSESQSPDGWNHRFGMLTGDVVLRGYTAFSIKDAHHAGQRLLRYGRLRIKPVCACAGRGQMCVSDTEQLAQILAGVDERNIALWGLTLEEDLQDVMTYSVGQTEVAGLLMSHIGTQQLTRNNEGEQVYGGSRLAVVRGDYTELFALNISQHAKLAINQARTYEAAAYQCFPGLLASRRNYDIAQGMTPQGEFRSGVLEQSWRIGGASGAEILALDAFDRDPSLSFVQAATREVYGACEPPDHAWILYRGNDAEVGPITKYVELITDDHTY
ncbi:MAG TPA: DUF3182 family protein [Cellvibrio sp.]|nr:DUF3182 family protein [Cellvibrio sp.]